MGRKKTSIAKFKTTPVTKIEFFVKGTSEKQINKIIIALKNLGVGSVDIKKGKLELDTSVKFNYGSSYNSANTHLSKFIGIYGKGEYSGEDVSVIK